MKPDSHADALSFVFVELIGLLGAEAAGSSDLRLSLLAPFALGDDVVAVGQPAEPADPADPTSSWSLRLENHRREAAFDVQAVAVPSRHLPHQGKAPEVSSS